MQADDDTLRASLLGHRAFVRSVARTLVLDPNEADDVEQQALLTALDRGPDDPARMRGWLARVASQPRHIPIDRS